MGKSSITNDEIVKITERSPIREKAFFTMIRQSGLSPNTLKKLQLKHIEEIQAETPIPCKIEVTQEIEKSPNGRHPSFIGEESVKHIKKYLAKRELTDKEELTPESLLFITHNKPNKGITPKEVNRTFKRIAHKIRKSKGDGLDLKDLRDVFVEKAQVIGYNNLNYIIGEVTDQNYKHENDEFYRQLYMDIIMDSLEIEPLTRSMLRLRDVQIKDLTQKFNFLFDGYKSIERIAKPLIDFHASKEDGELTIRVKQSLITDPMAEADRIKEELESEDEDNQETMCDVESRILTPREVKRAELEEWERTRERINSVPKELKEGELVMVVWGNFRKIETEVSYKRAEKVQDEVQPTPNNERETDSNV